MVKTPDEMRESLVRGLEQSANGEVEPLGDFSIYLDKDELEAIEAARDEATKAFMANE
jgi:hypothetical protein